MFGQYVCQNISWFWIFHLSLKMAFIMCTSLHKRMFRLSKALNIFFNIRQMDHPSYHQPQQGVTQTCAITARMLITHEDPGHEQKPKKVLHLSNIFLKQEKKVRMQEALHLCLRQAHVYLESLSPSFFPKKGQTIFCRDQV